MKKCTRCGAIIEDNMNMCYICGENDEFTDIKEYAPSRTSHQIEVLNKDTKLTYGKIWRKVLKYALSRTSHQTEVLNRGTKLTYGKIWRKVLNEDENILHEFSVGVRYRILKFILFESPALMLLVLGAISDEPAFYWFAMFCTLPGFFILWYLKIANAYAFTDKGVVAHTGWLNTSMKNINYDRITDSSVVDYFVERLIIKTGSLTINTAGTSEPELIFKRVESPYELKKILDKIIDKDKK